jgi:transcription elongation factor Elf1
MTARQMLTCPLCSSDELGSPRPGQRVTNTDGNAWYRCKQCSFRFAVAVDMLRARDMYIPAWALSDHTRPVETRTVRITHGRST